MSMNLSSLALLDRVFFMTRMLKSLVVIHLGKMKWGERVENDSSCQKWHYLFPSADSVEVINNEGL